MEQNDQNSMDMKVLGEITPSEFKERLDSLAKIISGREEKLPSFSGLNRAQRRQLQRQEERRRKKLQRELEKGLKSRYVEEDNRLI